MASWTSSGAATEDYVVDVVVEVPTGQADPDERIRRVALPGITLQQVTSRGTMWLTAVVDAPSEAAACRCVREAVLTAVHDIPGAAASAVVTGVALGELYAHLDTDLTDDEVERIDVRDLVRDQVWDRGGRGVEANNPLEPTG